MEDGDNAQAGAVATRLPGYLRPEPWGTHQMQTGEMARGCVAESAGPELLPTAQELSTSKAALPAGSRGVNKGHLSITGHCLLGSVELAWGPQRTPDVS